MLHVNKSYLIGLMVYWTSNLFICIMILINKEIGRHVSSWYVICTVTEIRLLCNNIVPSCFLTYRLFKFCLWSCIIISYITSYFGNDYSRFWKKFKDCFINVLLENISSNDNERKVTNIGFSFYITAFDRH